jgi:hypothetical protein
MNSDRSALKDKVKLLKNEHIRGSLNDRDLEDRLNGAHKSEAGRRNISIGGLAARNIKAVGYTTINGTGFSPKNATGININDSLIQEDSVHRDIIKNRGGNFSITGMPYAAIGRTIIQTDPKAFNKTNPSIFSSGVS